MKKILLILILLPQFFAYNHVVYAQSSADIVINEIAWPGSITSGTDEWIELFNNADSEADLTGLILYDDGEILYQFQGEKIPAKSYFLIEKVEEATSIQSDLIVSSISLANAGDELKLTDASGVIIDIVNTGGLAWFAGSASSRATMARIDASSKSDIATNWASSVINSSVTDSGGDNILGTPKAVNNIDEEEAIAENSGVYFRMQESNASKGDYVNFDIVYNGSTEIFSYGFEIELDEAQMTFQSAKKGNVLSEDGDIETSFQFGLEEGSNILILSEARLDSSKSLLSISGENILCDIKFLVVGDVGDKVDLTFLNNSFLSNYSGDIDTKFNNTSFDIHSLEIANPQNLSVLVSNEQYVFSFQWDPVEYADSYIIQKKMYGEFENISEVFTESFVDSNNIVPMHEYEYRIISKSGNQLSSGSIIKAMEIRGISGDFDRTNRVDGRDLEKLAKHWKDTVQSENFDMLVDINCDGEINALDLFEMSLNWGNKFE